jgi:hypothetical protein
MAEERIDECPECRNDHATCQQISRHEWRCVCGECGAVGKTGHNRLEAIDNWNNFFASEDEKEHSQ